jgi:ribonuclease HI
MLIEIYTDGSCRGNGKKENSGGWGFIVLVDGKYFYHDSNQEDNTTNNKMELTAILKSLEYADKNLGLDFGHKFLVYTDSAYCQRCYNEKWYKNWELNEWKTASKQPVKNKDIWEKLIPYFNNVNIALLKVKGHSGLDLNEAVDKLAKGEKIDVTCYNTTL